MTFGGYDSLSKMGPRTHFCYNETFINRSINRIGASMSSNKNSLSNLLPDTNRDVLSDSLVDNLVQPFLSKPNSDFSIGYVGERDLGDKTSPYLRGVDPDHEINALRPMMLITHGAEQQIVDFSDIINALKLEGIDTGDLTQYFTDKVFNLAFPIDIDKFSNFQSYYWMGYYSSPDAWNKTNAPEYYVIAKGGISDWSRSNKWIHVDDIDTDSIDISKCVQATRPIIEFFTTMESQLNQAYTADGIPCQLGIAGSITYVQHKSRFNQKPLFDLYRSNGTHAGVVSPILYFAESNVSPVDEALGARIIIDVDNDYIMEHGLVDEDGSYLYYRNTQYQNPLRTIWGYASTYTPSYAVDNGTGIPKVIPRDQIQLHPTGTWMTPAQVTNNLDHKIYKRIKYGDLFTHFISIIEAQDGISGSPFGKNNFRRLPMIDLGKGGKIKEFNSPYDLLFGIIAQPDISIENVINFSKTQYEVFINAAKEWATSNAILEYLDTDTYDFSGQLIDKLVSSFLRFNDRAGSIYYDTTSPIRNMIATLPYLKLVEAIEPRVVFDECTNLPMIRHHDGHRTLATRQDVAYKRQLAAMKRIRSNGQLTSGVITPNDPLSFGNPWKKMFWFNPDTAQLFVFDVASDNFDPTMDLVGSAGQYAYNRSRNLLWRSNGQTWLPEPDLSLPWKEFKPEDITNALIIRLERILYENVPQVRAPLAGTVPYNETHYATMATNYGGKWRALMEKQFIEYAARQKLDPYAHTFFNASDPFTWNYSNMPLAAGTGAMWYDVYAKVYDTARPDIHPHTLLGVGYEQTESKLHDLLNDAAIAAAAATLPVVVNGNTITAVNDMNLLSFAGQLFFDAATSRLYFFNAIDTWDQVTVPSDGTTWYDSASDRVFRAVAGVWIQITKQQACSEVTVSSMNYLAMWSLIRAWLTSHRKLVNVPLSVNFMTGELLPPWVSGDDDAAQWALANHGNPQSYQIRKDFVFGQNGLVEYGWKSSVDYLYDRLNVSYKCEPMKFILDTWGYQYKRVQSDELLIDLYHEKKLNKSEYYLHGESVTDIRDLSSLLQVTSDRSYRFNDIAFTHATTARRFSAKCVMLGTTSSVFMVQYFELTSPTQQQLDAGILPEFELKNEIAYETNTVYDHNDVQFQIVESLRGHKLGDSYELNIGVDDTVTQNFKHAIGTKLERVRLVVRVIDTYQTDAEFMHEIQLLRDPTPEQRAAGASATWEVRDIHVGRCSVDELVHIQGLSFGVSAPRDGYYTDDTFIVTLSDLEEPLGVTFKNASIFKIAGLNQWYVDYARYTSRDLKISANAQIFRNWELKLGYRSGGLIETGNLKIRSDYFGLTSDNFTTHIKVNHAIRRATMHGLHIELIRIGSSRTVGGLLVPADGGSDWTYRISVLNKKDPWISLCVPNYDGPRATFNALEKAHCDWTWSTPLEFEKDLDGANVRISVGAPFTITGVQNLVDFISAYSETLKLDGWVFDDDYNADIDVETGRRITWQLEIEKFIDQQWIGMSIDNPIDGIVAKLTDIAAPYAGMRVLNMFDGRLYSFENGAFNGSDPWTGMKVFNRLNADGYQYDGVEWRMTTFGNYIAAPFKRRVSFRADRGVISEFTRESGLDPKISTYATDINGDHLTIDSDLRIVRNDDTSYIIADVPMMYLGVNIDEYEHVVLFDSYVNGKLIFDSFLGMRVARIHFTTEKQRIFNGRLNYGGHYLGRDGVRENIEKSILGLGNAYDVQRLSESSPFTDALRSSVGFNRSTYYRALDMSQKAELQMWRGVIKGKGSNESINSYINNKRFKDAKVDDLWIYKIAEFGDARNANYPEMRIQSSDVTSKITKFQLHSTRDTNPQPDAITLHEVDESRWFNPEDRASDLKFITKKYGEFTIDISNVGPMILPAQLRSCDVFELEIDDPTYDGIVIPTGRHVAIIGLTEITETKPADYSNEKYPYAELSSDGLSIVYGETFEMVNCAVLNIIDQALIGRRVRISGFGPSYSEFGPIKVIDYQTESIVDEIEYFDPARGQMISSVTSNIDISAPTDPANYTFRSKSVNTDKRAKRPWGIDQVGTVWCDTSSIEYLPYYDSHIFTTENERISHWGALSDWSMPRVHQWVSSPVHPKDWESYVSANSLVAGGIPSARKFYSRARTWSRRPVAWKRASIAGASGGIDRSFIASGEAGLYIGNAGVIGTTTLYMIERRFADYGLTIGTKVAGAAMVDLNIDLGREITKIFGLGTIISDQFVTVGSVANPAAPILNQTTVFDEVAIALDETADVGTLVMSSQDIAGTTYLKLTNVTTGTSQLLEVTDTPDLAGAIIKFVFTDLGVTLSCRTKFAHDEEWIDDNTNTVATTTAAQRIAFIVDVFGNVDNDVVIYSAVNMMVEVPFVDGAIISSLPAKLDNDEVSWIAWTEPTDDQLSSDLSFPNNEWEPIFGEWYTVTIAEAASAAMDIQASFAGVTVTNDGIDISKWKQTWSSWIPLSPAVRQCYITALPLSVDPAAVSVLNWTDLDLTIIKNRISVYVNGKQIFDEFTVSKNQIGLTRALAIGDHLMVRIAEYEPTADELTWDPTINIRPKQVLQYSIDYDYVVEQTRDLDGRANGNRYFFWVEKLQYPAPGKTLSIATVVNKLVHMDEPYIAVQNPISEI